MHLVEHLEQYCGPIVEGWKTDPDGNPRPYQIVRLQNGPVQGTTTYSTLGLSEIPLRSQWTGDVVRLELLMVARKNAVPRNLPAVLQQVADEAVSRNSAYLRGEVIGPRGSLFDHSTMTALLVCNAAYFPEGFETCVVPHLGRVIMAWLVPITQDEAVYVTGQGWDKFEALLIRDNPDLLDFQRPSIVVGSGAIN